MLFYVLTLLRNRKVGHTNFILSIQFSLFLVCIKNKLRTRNFNLELLSAAFIQKVIEIQALPNAKVVSNMQQTFRDILEFWHCNIRNA